MGSGESDATAGSNHEKDKVLINGLVSGQVAAAVS